MHLAIKIICMKVLNKTINKFLTLLFIFNSIPWFVNGQVSFSYDEVGNRLNKITKSQITPVFISPQKGKSYQWQQNSGSGFQSITNNTIYTGANSIALILNKPPTTWYGYLYRCVVNTGSGIVNTVPDTLTFSTEWTGKSNIAWENITNWCCGIMPDSNTNVLIRKDAVFYPIIVNDSKVRSLKLDSSSTVILAAGKKLDIKH